MLILALVAVGAISGLVALGPVVGGVFGQVAKNLEPVVGVSLAAASEGPIVDVSARRTGFGYGNDVVVRVTVSESTTVTATDPDLPPDTLTYTIVASNNGPSNASNVSVANAITSVPFVANAQWTCVAAGGATCTAGPTSGAVASSSSKSLSSDRCARAVSMPVPHSW